jgi:hypothetical protein
MEDTITTVRRKARKKVLQQKISALPGPSSNAFRLSAASTRRACDISNTGMPFRTQNIR